MKKVFAWIKAHPLTLVLIVGVAILVLVLFRGGSSGGTTVVASGPSGPSDAAVAASASLAANQDNNATQLSIAQMQGTVQLHAIDTSVVQQVNQQSFQLAEDQINANASTYNSKVGADVQLAGIGAQRDVQLAGIAAGVQTADLANQASLAQAGIYKDIFTSQAHLQETQANDNAAVAINGQNVQGSVLTTEYNDAAAAAINSQNVSGQVQITGINASRDVNLSAIDAQKSVALAPFQLASTAINKGALNLGTKDAFLNLPGFSAGRATNFTPPGATAGQPNPFTGFLTALGNGIGNALPAAFG